MNIFTKIHRAAKYRRIKRIRSYRSKKFDAPYDQCKNCGSMLEGIYCHKCGQYALDTKQSFWKFIQQYFDNTYQVDGRFLRTFWLLFFLPGFLTEEFVKGRIVSYVHPLKMYLFCSIVFFALAFLFVPSDIGSDKDKSANETSLKINEDSLSTEQKLAIKNKIVNTYKGNRLLTSDSAKLANMGVVDSLIEFSDSLLTVNKDVKTVVRSKNRLEEKIFYQSFIGSVKTYLPLVMLILMPIYGLLLGMFFRRRYKNYMPHFVFAVHVNIFTIILALILALMFWFGATAGTYSMTLYAVLSLHIILATKRFYKQGWIKTLIKSFVVYAMYALISLIFILLLIIAVVFMIKAEI